jgi:single-strand DNA-binding protein
MQGLNRVQLIGALGNNPDFKEVSGRGLATISIATNERFQNKAGEWQEKTEWHRVVAWGKLAEICAATLSKGSQAYVEGKLETRSWVTKDGEKKYTTEVVASQVFALARAQKTHTAAGDQLPVRNVADERGEAGSSELDDLPF